MDYLKKFLESASKIVPEPSIKALSEYPHQRKMEYILQRIKSTNDKTMNEITEEFQEKIFYQQNVCYDQFKTDVEAYSSCCYRVKKSAEARVEFYKKKVAFLSLATSKCLNEEPSGQHVMKCRDQALSTAKDIMNSELEYIKNWNPHVAHVSAFQE